MSYEIRIVIFHSVSQSDEFFFIHGIKSCWSFSRTVTAFVNAIQVPPPSNRELWSEGVLEQVPSVPRWMLPQKRHVSITDIKWGGTWWCVSICRQVRNRHISGNHNAHKWPKSSYRIEELSNSVKQRSLSFYPLLLYEEEHNRAESAFPSWWFRRNRINSFDNQWIKSMDNLF